MLWENKRGSVLMVGNQRRQQLRRYWRLKVFEERRI